MQGRLAYKGIEKILLARLPELGPLVERELWYMKPPLAYPVFEDVLKHSLFDLLDLGGDDPLLPRIFAFLEEMAGNPDKEVVNLLWIAILEPLTFRRDLVRRSWKYMGPKTRELAREVGRRGGWSENLPPPGGSVDNE